MIRALILDYNGVLVNDEAIHRAAIQRVFARVGIRLGEAEYASRYLGLPDRDIGRDLLKRLGGKEDGPALDDEIDHLMALKAMAYRDAVRRDLPEVPGASGFVARAAERYPIAVASGAIREEVEDGLYRLGVRDQISAVVTIENVSRGKPDPEVLLAAREALIRVCTTPEARHPLRPAEPPASFLVLEDSPPGLAAARAAWMPAVAVATSYPASDLIPSALVVPDLAALDLEAIAAL